MFRVAFKFDIDPADADWRRAWRVTGCWHVNENASRAVKVECKNRKDGSRLLVLSPFRVPVHYRIDPTSIVRSYLYSLTNEQKAALCQR